MGQSLKQSGGETAEGGPLSKPIDGSTASALVVFLSRYPGAEIMVADARDGVEKVLRVGSERQLQASADRTNWLAVSAHVGRFRLTAGSLAFFRQKTEEDELAKAPLVEAEGYLGEYLECRTRDTKEHARTEARRKALALVAEILQNISSQHMRIGWMSDMRILITRSPQRVALRELLFLLKVEKRCDPFYGVRSLVLTGAKNIVVQSLNQVFKDKKPDFMLLFEAAKDVHVYCSIEGVGDLVFKLV